MQAVSEDTFVMITMLRRIRALHFALGRIKFIVMAVLLDLSHFSIFATVANMAYDMICFEVFCKTSFSVQAQEAYYTNQRNEHRRGNFLLSHQPTSALSLDIVHVLLSCGTFSTRTFG